MASKGTRIVTLMTAIAMFPMCGCTQTVPIPDQATIEAHLEAVKQEELAQNKLRVAEDKERAKRKPKGE
jgi:hypothetical protein